MTTRADATRPVTIQRCLSDGCAAHHPFAPHHCHPNHGCQHQFIRSLPHCSATFPALCSVWAHSWSFTTCHSFSSRCLSQQVQLLPWAPSRSTSPTFTSHAARCTRKFQSTLLCILNAVPNTTYPPVGYPSLPSVWRCAMQGPHTGSFTSYVCSFTSYVCAHSPHTHVHSSIQWVWCDAQSKAGFHKAGFNVQTSHRTDLIPPRDAHVTVHSTLHYYTQHIRSSTGTAQLSHASAAKQQPALHQWWSSA